MPSTLRRLTTSAVLAAALAGCSVAPPPIHDPLRAAPDRNPLVVVPGLTGAELLTADGSRAWGDGRSLLVPHDGGRQIALPIVAGSGAALSPGRVIESIRLTPLVVKEVYGPIVELLEANGYRRGDLAAPAAGDSLFLYAYDWRRELSAAAVELHAALDRLREARGAPTLAVDLVCQSAGALICRYLAKYGGAPLAEAESARPAGRVVVDKVIFVGTSNGGSLRILKEIDRGRRYVPLVGRRFRPEVLFTFASLFQDLPVYRSDLFVGPEGAALDVDLFEAASWERYEWSIFAPEARRRVARAAGSQWGDSKDWLAHLRRSLDQASRLHELLARDVESFGSRYYSIQNRSDPTPERALIAPGRGGGWKLLFAGDRGLRRSSELYSALIGVGDGHAATGSQEWLSPQETAALACPALEVRGEHFEMILEEVARRRLLRYLSGSCGL